MEYEKYKRRNPEKKKNRISLGLVKGQGEVKHQMRCFQCSEMTKHADGTSSGPSQQSTRMKNDGGRHSPPPPLR